MHRTRQARSILIWHVHGSWMHAFVSGPHRYLLPTNSSRDADGRGRSGRAWPNAHEVPVGARIQEPVDLVVLQRPHELQLAARLLGCEPGIDLPAVYVEHNAPRPHAAESTHPLAERCDVPIVHVTEFNRLMWDSGAAPTVVIDHGIEDPGPRYTGEIPAAASMINDPLRRGRTVGTDLLEPLSSYAPIDVWGIGTDRLNSSTRLSRVQGRGDISGPAVLEHVSRRSCYLHTARWTSLGLSLIEAMYCGMPIAAVASTMAPLVVPPEAGVVSADVSVLGEALAEFTSDTASARMFGKAAREFACETFRIDRFRDQWNQLIEEICA
ncbi:transferase [Mycobacteroides abscessus subsp. massiliense]|nr:transferase [Mycobacteroides abscessus subsp. massiliense]